jgi:hypothetical protein
MFANPSPVGLLPIESTLRIVVLKKYGTAGEEQ